MLDFKENKKSLFVEINKLVNDFNSGAAELKRFDFQIVTIFKDIIEESIVFLLPNTPTDYPNYQLKKKIERFELNTIYAFEYNFVDYDQVFFGSNKHLEVNNPYFIFIVPEKNKKTLEISRMVGNKIKGDLAFCIRKNTNYWELPLKAFVIDKELDCIQEIELFSNLYFQLKIDNKEDLLNIAELSYREDLIEKIKLFSNIVLNEDEELFAKDSETFIPSSFMTNKKDLSFHTQQERLRNQKKLLFNINLLYSRSIQF